MAKSTRPLNGFTRYAKPEGEAQPSGFILSDSAGDEYYLWFDTTGDLRTAAVATAEAAGFNWLTGGTVVGGQS